MIHFVVPAGAEWTLHEYFSRWGAGVADRFRILHYESLADRTSFDRGTYVLAGLQLTPGLQRLVEELFQTTVRRGGRPVSQPPDADFAPLMHFSKSFIAGN